MAKRVAKALTPIQALDRVQRLMDLEPRDAGLWAAALRAERKATSRRRESHSLAGILPGEPVPSLEGFRSVRTLLSDALRRRAGGRGPVRR